MKKIWLFSLCLILPSTVFAKITANFTPNPVKQGDAVELVLSSDKSFAGVPNVDILQKDFVVGGQQSRHSAQWINGKGQDLHQLIYTLFPNKSGDITVHGLKVGNELIPDLILNVRADAKYATKGSIDLSVECQKTPVYPSQKMLCTVFMDDSIGLVDGEIIPPQSAQGTWEQIMPPLPIASNKTGTNRYQSTFAFTPKDSGTFQISPFVFQGSARLKTGERQGTNIIDLMFMAFQSSSATQPVGAQSAPFSITVKAKPADYKGWWLPSPRVTLTESYQFPENIAVGEPITRTLTLTAQQVMADNMPVPETSSTDKLKVYTNPAERHDTPEGGQVITTMTFVPTQSGEVTLPAIQIPWFDSVHEKTEFASVPEHKIFVTGETISQPQTPTPVAQVAPVSEQEILATQEQAQQPVPAQPSQQLPWLWIILGLSLAFVFGIIVAVLILKRTTSTEHKKKKPLPDLYPF